jgi:hypothetical protein
MTSLNNNNIREDAIFKGKVKDTLLRSSGSAGLVNVLLDFNARDAAAVPAQSSHDASGTPSTSSVASASSTRGLTYAQFIAFLTDYGVELSPFEQQYLCRAFDDTGSGVISASTFTRHLIGLNERRMRAVKKAWSALERDAEGAERGVTRELLLSTYESAQPLQQQQQQGSVLSTTFDSRRRQLKEDCLASTTGVSATAAAATGEGPHNKSSYSSGDGDEVSYAEFMAFYAGISPQFGADEDFVAHVLKTCAADDTTRPTLSETTREWGPDGDPLALDGPRYVQDALNRSLGVSSKSYNVSHMQREHPYVEPLPPLNRPDIMITTMQKTYVRFDEAELTLANPLATRRGQDM